MKITKVKKCRVLTFQGWVLVLLAFSASFLLFIKTAHDYLAVTRPVQADLLVIEGWVSDAAIEAAIKEFQDQSYELILTTGVSLEKGHFLSRYSDYATLTAETIRELGIETEKIISVPAGKVDRDRTYQSAVALNRWLEKSEARYRSLNIVTEGAHARRTWRIYSKVCSNDYRVGIISFPEAEYDPENWWKFSEGVKSVVFESLANIYISVAY